MRTQFIKSSLSLLKKHYKVLLLVSAVITLVNVALLLLLDALFPGADKVRLARDLIISLQFATIIQAITVKIIYDDKTQTRSKAGILILYGIEKWIPILVAGAIASGVLVASILPSIAMFVLAQQLSPLFYIAAILLLALPLYIMLRLAFLPAIVCLEEDRTRQAALLSYVTTKGKVSALLKISVILGGGALLVEALLAELSKLIISLSAFEAGSTLATLIEVPFDTLTLFTAAVVDIAIVLVYFEGKSTSVAAAKN